MSRRSDSKRPGTSPGPTRPAAVGDPVLDSAVADLGSRRKRKGRERPNPCALASAFLGQIDEIAEQTAGVLDLRRRRPRFDREGRRLARVHSIFRPGRETGGGREPGKALPMVRLSGRWLQESGFPVGKRYSIEVEDGELVIRAL